MDTSLRYESPDGTSVEFSPGSAYHYAGAGVHDYSWDYETRNGKVTDFHKEPATFEIEAVVAGGSEGARNEMTECFERDVLRQRPGRLWSGGYYLECYVVASEKDQWWWDAGHMHARLTVLAESPMWVHEESKLMGTDRDSDETAIDHPFDYAFDFASPIVVHRSVNTGIVPSPFKIEVHGPTTPHEHVEIVIGTNVYAVDVQLAEGEELAIDSRSKTIVLKRPDGTEENVFDKRVGTQVAGSGSYVFEGIAPGFNQVSWPGDYTFTLTAYDERSEPRW